MDFTPLTLQGLCQPTPYRASTGAPSLSSVEWSCCPYHARVLDSFQLHKNFHNVDIYSFYIIHQLHCSPVQFSAVPDQHHIVKACMCLAKLMLIALEWAASAVTDCKVTLRGRSVC